MTTNHPTYRTAVMNIQRYLRSFSDGSEGTDVFSVPIDGIYDTRTKNALSEFQRLYSLPVTGITDKSTFDTLYIEYQKRLIRDTRRSNPEFFPVSPSDYETEFGEKSSFISILQFVLDELRISYDTIPAFEMNGTFDGDRQGK